MYICMCMSKVTERVSLLVSGLLTLGFLSEANSTLASSSSTSYKTRGYLTHWKVYDATLKTNPFTYFHFSRDPFCLPHLIFSLLQD